MALVEAQGIAKAYAGEGATTVALHPVSFVIERGEFVSIMGPSGSGKSTLLHILGLLDRPDSGSYRLADQDTATLSDEAQARLRNTTIGFVFQAFHLLARATVLDNVVMPLQYSALPRREYEVRAREALAQVNLSHRLTHTPSQLSGGEKQRVAIARALVNKPELILADEPTGNLDSSSGHAVMELIDQLHQQGHTIIVITHETPTANYAQRILELRDGTITGDRATERGHQHYTK
jgi:ABC-type lipoprotein export system ATPase subunit